MLLEKYISTFILFIMFLCFYISYDDIILLFYNFVYLILLFIYGPDCRLTTCHLFMPSSDCNCMIKILEKIK